MKNTIILAILGFFSGIISYIFSFPITILETFGMYTIPGIIFGATISFYFIVRKLQTSPKKILSFIIISTIGYFLAIWCTLNGLYVIESLEIMLFVSGLIGAFVMLSGFRHYLYHLNNTQLVYLTLIGGMLALTFVIVPEDFIFKDTSDWSWPQSQTLALILVWQTGMAGALGWILDRSKIKQK